MRPLTSFERQLCQIQGRLFELSAKAQYSSQHFIEGFMKSESAAALDRDYDRLQWAGEEYILAEVTEEIHIPKGNTYHNEVLFWIGYTYRYWHFLTGESSSEIVKQANPETMNQCYLGFHTLDVALAIEELKDLYTFNRLKYGNS